MCLKLTKVEFTFRSKIMLPKFFVLSASASVFDLRPNICWPEFKSPDAKGRPVGQ